MIYQMKASLLRFIELFSGRKLLSYLQVGKLKHHDGTTQALIFAYEHRLIMHERLKLNA